jgi:hypothetical protein
MTKRIIQNKAGDISNEDITRKEALKKAGKYAALTAATMLVILSPKDSQAQSPPNPGWGN